MLIINLFLYFFTASLFTFGGGSVIAVVLQDLFVVQNHLITNQQFLTAMAIGRLTPGPVTIFTVTIGYFLAGFTGSVIATLAATIPSLLIFPVEKFYYKIEKSYIAYGFIRGVSIAIVGLIFGTVLRLAPGIINTVFDLLILGVAFILMSKFKISVAKIISIAFIFGTIYALWIK